MRNSIQSAYKNNIKIKLYNYNTNERIYKLLGDNTNINRVVKRVINFLHWQISRQQIMGMIGNFFKMKRKCSNGNIFSKGFQK